jgi:hypothetical protein
MRRRTFCNSITEGIAGLTTIGLFGKGTPRLPSELPVAPSLLASKAGWFPALTGHAPIIRLRLILIPFLRLTCTNTLRETAGDFGRKRS